MRRSSMKSIQLIWISDVSTNIVLLIQYLYNIYRGEDYHSEKSFLSKPHTLNSLHIVKRLFPR